MYQAKRPNLWNVCLSGLMPIKVSDLYAFNCVVCCYSLCKVAIWPNVVEVHNVCGLPRNSTLKISAIIVNYYKYICIYWFRTFPAILSDVNSWTVLIMQGVIFLKNRPQELSDRTRFSNNIIVGWSIAFIPTSETPKPWPPSGRFLRLFWQNKPGSSHVPTNSQLYYVPAAWQVDMKILLISRNSS